MDLTTIILSALTAGATAALQEVTGTAIKDGFKELTALLKKKFSKDAKAKAILESHAKDPETWNKPLEKTLRDAKISDDAAILASAQKLLKTIQSQQTGTKYETKFTGDVQGVNQGDFNNVTMNFDNSPSKRKKGK